VCRSVFRKERGQLSPLHVAFETVGVLVGFQA
jgi:hypothetical protein